jgi:hypothetical protein
MSIIEFIRDRARYYNCPVCGRTLKGCNVRMLSQDEDRFTVQVTCGSCEVTFIMILAVQGAGLEAITAGAHLETEQDQERRPVAEEVVERESMATRDTIDADELLDLHLVLRDFCGPLTQLVRQQHPVR